MPQEQKKNNVIPFKGIRVKADTDKGYTRLADELIEALAMVELSGGQFRAMIAIIRKTYGYNKKADWISASQIAEIMGRDPRDANVRRDVAELKKRKLILVDGRAMGPNPMLSDWEFKKAKRTKTSPRRTISSVPKRHQKCDENVTTPDENVTKNVTKSTPTKEKRQYSKEKRQGAGAPVSLPAFIDPDKFAAFVDSRKRMRKPLTDRALELAVEKLARFHNEGHDVGAIIDEAVLNGWQSFYPLKNSGPAKSPHQDRNAQEIAEWLAEGGDV